MTPMRALWFCLGMAALGLAVLGAVLPLLPTTPFLLVAAYGFARSSQRWHDWLMRHRVFGPLIENWRAHGAIGRRTKIISVISIIGVFCFSLAIGVAPLFLAIQGAVLVCSALFVVTRPAPPKG